MIIKEIYLDILILEDYLKRRNYIIKAFKLLSVMVELQATIDIIKLTISL